MKDVFVNSLMYSVNKYKDFDDVKLKEIKYGIESLYLAVSKTIVIFSLALLLGLFKSLLHLMIAYTLLRLNGFGLHAKKSWQCWAGSIFLFLPIAYLCSTIYIEKEIQLILSSFCLVLIGKYAPADTEKRPLINMSKRRLHKILCVITTLMYIIVIAILKNNYYCNILFSAIVIQTMLVLPISYKIFKLRYNNYKSYIKQN